MNRALCTQPLPSVRIYFLEKKYVNHTVLDNELSLVRVTPLPNELTLRVHFVTYNFLAFLLLKKLHMDTLADGGLLCDFTCNLTLIYLKWLWLARPLEISILSCKKVLKLSLGLPVWACSLNASLPFYWGRRMLILTTSFSFLGIIFFTISVSQFSLLLVLEACFLNFP